MHLVMDHLSRCRRASRLEQRGGDLSSEDLGESVGKRGMMVTT